MIDAGLVDVAVTDVSAPVRAGSVDEWWQRTSALAGPLAQRLASLSKDAQAALRGRVDAAIAPYVSAGGLDFPGLSLIATGRRLS